MESVISEYQVGGYGREPTGAILPNVVTVERAPDGRRLMEHQRELDDLIACWTSERNAGSLRELPVEHGVPIGARRRRFGL